MATHCAFPAPSLKGAKARTTVTVKLRVQETYLDCGSLQYLEDPRFTGYRVDPEVDTELEVKILVRFSSFVGGGSRPGGKGVLACVRFHGHPTSSSSLRSSQKENDNFNISKKDIEITLFHGENQQLNCSFENITRNQDLTTILCKIKGLSAANSIASSSRKVHVSHRPSCVLPDLGGFLGEPGSQSGPFPGSLGLHLNQRMNSVGVVLLAQAYVLRNSCQNPSMRPLECQSGEHVIVDTANES